MPAEVRALECWSAVPNTNSQSSGCAERVKMSTWSWRILRISAWAMAAVPAARRVSALLASPWGHSVSAEPLGHATLGADIRQPPLSTLDGLPRHCREHLFEAFDAVLVAKMCRRTELDYVPAVHDRELLAMALGLLHLVGGHDDGRTRLDPQRVEALPD